MAIVWAVQRCRMYLAGSNFKVIIDHQPLLGILNGKNMEAVNNTGIQRLMAKLLGFNFTIEFQRDSPKETYQRDLLKRLTKEIVLKRSYQRDVTKETSPKRLHHATSPSQCSLTRNSYHKQAAVCCSFCCYSSQLDFRLKRPAAIKF